MNRPTTIGVLLVAFLVPPAASAHATSAETQASTPRWTVTTTTDPLTDKKLMTATISESNVPQFVYQLELKCPASSVPEVHIATFDLTNTVAGEHNARTIPWTNNAEAINEIRRENALTRARLGSTATWQLFMKDEGELKWSRSFEYRLDSFPVHTAHLQQTYSNAGWVTMPTIPTTRLVVAGLFPGETIVFPFDVLTVDQRNVMQTMCLLSPSK